VAPYKKWQYYDSRHRQKEQSINYALNKTKKVAWFVSNCGARNGRLQYAHELQKYINVSFIFSIFSFYIMIVFPFVFKGRHLWGLWKFQMPQEHG